MKSYPNVHADTQFADLRPSDSKPTYVEPIAASDMPANPYDLLLSMLGFMGGLIPMTFVVLLLALLGYYGSDIVDFFRSIS